MYLFVTVEQKNVEEMSKARNNAFNIERLDLTIRFLLVKRWKWISPNTPSLCCTDTRDDETALIMKIQRGWNNKTERNLLADSL